MNAWPMKFRLITLLGCFCFACLPALLGQQQQEIDRMRGAYVAPSPQKTGNPPAQPSPPQLIYWGYKRLISSQDSKKCSFHPSCSTYALQSIQHKGFVRGGLAALDRLARCHPLSPEWYARHPETGLLSDPAKP